MEKTWNKIFFTSYGRYDFNKDTTVAYFGRLILIKLYSRFYDVNIVKDR